jgi:hypothetical protein
MDLMIINRLLDEIKELNAQKVEHERSKKKDDPYQSEQINELVAALAKAQGSYPSIGADRENPYFKSNYADLDMILKAIRSCLRDNNLSFVQDTRFTEDGSTILHSRLYHSSGQWIETRARILPVKNTPQEYGSCLTYNKRYSAMALLGITVSSDPTDDDAEVAMIHSRDIIAKGPSNKYNPKEQTRETVTKEQIEELEYELAGAPDLEEEVLEKMQIQSLADMPKSKYMASLQRIREIKLKRNGAK